MTVVQGAYAAAITPRGKHGDIDFGASFELIDFLCKGGVKGIALYAPAGEFAALNNDERSRLAYLAIKRSRVPVLVGVGSATLDASVSLAREARDAGAAGLLLPPAYCVPCDQADLREFYLQFAAQAGGGTPIFLSQPPHGGVSLETSTALDLLSTGHFAGIEIDCAADSAAMLHAAGQGNPWQILAVDDAILAASRRSGASAAISSAACALPELIGALDCAIALQNEARAVELEGRLQEFLTWASRFPPPAALKEATRLRGLKTGPLAVPLSPDKKALMEQFRDWFGNWLPVTKKLAAHG